MFFADIGIHDENIQDLPILNVSDASYHLVWIVSDSASGAQIAQYPSNFVILSTLLYFDEPSFVLFEGAHLAWISIYI